MHAVFFPSLLSYPYALVAWIHRAGLSNYLYLCSLPAHQRAKCTNEPGEVLLRVYGEIFFEGETPLLDTVIFSLLSERRQAPKLYGVFSEGRLEEFIPVSSIFDQTFGDDEKRLLRRSRMMMTDDVGEQNMSRMLVMMMMMV